MLIEEKKKLNKFLNESIRKFPDNENIKELKGKFDDIFCNDDVGENDDVAEDANNTGKDA